MDADTFKVYILHTMGKLRQDIIHVHKIPLSELYTKKVQTIDVQIRRNFEYMNVALSTVVYNFNEPIVFKGQGNICDFLPSFKRTDVICHFDIINDIPNVYIDTVLNTHDLFLYYPITLFQYYSQENYDIDFLPDVSLRIANDRTQLMYIFDNFGLPMDEVTRGALYVRIQIVIPTHIEDNNCLDHVKKCFDTTNGNTITLDLRQF